MSILPIITLVYKGYGFYLYKLGYKIIGIDNLNNGYEENLTINNTKWCKFYNADIRDKKRINYIIKKEKIDAILHLAAITSLPECEENSKSCFLNNIQLSSFSSSSESSISS